MAAGERHLAAVPLVCFEWHQRPENVLRATSPEAARLYKRTETQRTMAARKRRAWVESGSNDERSEAESQNGAAAGKSE
ncbi:MULTISPECIES: hypothetical protein [unclassified Hyphomicrobium]|uniref:hypothetical protein n=1 Tax=unclassified Hyphomicrobium TaxID=2619925 RepID=UPI00031D3DC0|nr:MULTISPECIES: hypothetical protein [unclassified Hyphomicrobium]